MITFYEEKDLVSFGEYLLSEKRDALIINNEAFENLKQCKERLQAVYQSDLENWKESQKSKELVTDSNEVVTK
jgi:hypothetical protein